MCQAPFILLTTACSFPECKYQPPFAQFYFWLVCFWLDKSVLNCSVSVRVRPLSEVEAEKGAAWRIEGNTIQPAGRDAADGGYSLDNVFDSSWSTEAVYQHTTKDLVKKVVGGFNGTVFAYGQTSSGKTHTMRGTASDPGIVPLAVQDIFNHISSTQDREYLVRVSYMEVTLPQITR